MATVRAILTDALTEIGALSVGETPSAADAALGLLRFQNLIDAWAAEQLALYVTPRITFTIPSGTSSLTIGDGGDIDVLRPTFIQGMNYLVPGANPPVETPMGEMDYDQYMALSIKALSSSLPTQFYFSNGAPLAEFKFWPVVNQAVDCALYYPHGLGVPASLNADIIGPAGWQEALMYQLALRLCGPFARPLPETLPRMAADAFALVKRSNTMPPLLGVDQALVPAYGGAYNVLNDGYTGSSGRG